MHYWHCIFSLAFFPCSNWMVHAHYEASQNPWNDIRNFLVRAETTEEIRELLFVHIWLLVQKVYGFLSHLLTHYYIAAWKIWTTTTHELWRPRHLKLLPDLWPREAKIEQEKEMNGTIKQIWVYLSREKKWTRKVRRF